MREPLGIVMTQFNIVRYIKYEIFRISFALLMSVVVPCARNPDNSYEPI